MFSLKSNLAESLVGEGGWDTDACFTLSCLCVFCLMLSAFFNLTIITVTCQNRHGCYSHKFSRGEEFEKVSGLDFVVEMMHSVSF